MNDEPRKPEDTTRFSPQIDSGQTIGPYVVHERIGSGGMGEVWKVTQTEPIRRTAALKLIRAGFDSKEVLARFEAEREALALMDHPCIAKVYDAGTTPDHRPYIAMEYVPGISIVDYCDRSRLDTNARLQLFMQVCEGVQHAHHKTILHRDLKPSNILVTEVDDKPVPKIIDFGVAKATSQPLTSGTMFTAQGQLIGTPEYMSPEQANMGPEGVDTRTDVYSLGVVLYRLLTGSLPLEFDDVRPGALPEIIKMIWEKDPPSPSTRISTLGEQLTQVAKQRRSAPEHLRQTISGDLDAIVMKALDKDRHRRYYSPKDLADDIRRFVNNEPVLATRPSTLYRLRKFARRNRAAVTASALVLMALILGMAGTTVGMIRANRAETQSRLDAETSQRVSSFLQDLFRSVDPNESQGEEVTARQMLDEGTRKIEDELSEEPLVQAQLMMIMGQTYANLGQYDQALPLLKRSVALRRAELGGHHADLGGSLNALGNLLDDMGRYEEAKVVMEEALDVRVQALGENHLDVSATCNNLAVILVRLDDTEGASDMWHRSLRIKEALLEPDDPSIGLTLNNLGILHRISGDYEKAADFYSQALTIRERGLGPRHPEVAQTLQNLALLSSYLQDYETARAYGNRSLEIHREVFDPEHPKVAAVLGVLAEIHQKEGDLEGALNLYQDAVAIQEKALEPGHLEIAQNLTEMGKILGQLDRADAAVPILEQAIDIKIAALGIDHYNVAETRYEMGVVLSNVGDYARALPLLQSSLKTREESGGADHPKVAASLVALGVLQTRTEAFSAAQVSLDRALAIYKVAEEMDQASGALALSALATLHRERGDYSVANDTYARAQEILEAELGPSHPETRKNRAAYDESKQRSGEASRAGM